MCADRLTDELAHAQSRPCNETRRSRGLPVDHETFESQLEDLISSTYDQMAHVPARVAALRYKMTRYYLSGIALVLSFAQSVIREPTIIGLTFGTHVYWRKLMKNYLIAGVVLWVLANAFGLGLGLEYILSLPAICIFILIVGLFFV